MHCTETCNFVLSYSEGTGKNHSLARPLECVQCILYKNVNTWLFSSELCSVSVECVCVFVSARTSISLQTNIYIRQFHSFVSKMPPTSIICIASLPPSFPPSYFSMCKYLRNMCSTFKKWGTVNTIRTVREQRDLGKKRRRNIKAHWSCLTTYTCLSSCKFLTCHV